MRGGARRARASSIAEQWLGHLSGALEETVSDVEARALEHVEPVFAFTKARPVGLSDAGLFVMSRNAN